MARFMCETHRRAWNSVAASATVLACVLFPFLGGGARAADTASPEPLFYLPFDGTAKAQKASGKAEPLKEVNPTYGEGVNGQALLAGPETLIEYATAGNLNQSEGTITLWFKPNWNGNEYASDSDKKNWHCLFAEPRPPKRLGSGALWFWLWGPMLRGDVSDEKDSYNCFAAPLRKGEWHHFAFVWEGERGARLYMDGKGGNAEQRDGGSMLGIAQGKKTIPAALESFFVGCHGEREQADGFIDEFKIFGAPLSTEQILAEVAKVRPVRLECSREYFKTDEKLSLQCVLTNISSASLDGEWSWKLVGPAGAVVAEKSGIAISLKAGGAESLTCDVPGLKEGGYDLLVTAPVKTMEPLSCGIWVLRKNPMIQHDGKLDLKLIETIDFTKEITPERFVAAGEHRMGTLDGQAYLEAGAKGNDRFAVRVELPRPSAPYLLEWSYPDDKKRTMEVIVQNAAAAGEGYDLQTGVFCGDEYPSTGKMLTHRCVYWAREKDIAVIFMTARKDAPAAVSQVRIYEINGGLPDAAVKTVAPVDGWTRTMAVYFEDPAVGFDFGVSAGTMPGYEEMLDRLEAYMKWSGQNMLIYPAVWYQGAMYPSSTPPYMPRLHPRDYIRCILEKFEPEGLTFMPTINLHNIPLRGKYEISQATVDSGALHSSPVMILNTGKPNPGGWHGTPPNFNPLHPETQAAINLYVDEMLALYADSPAFKGIVFHLTKHATLWFGCLEAGYNDYNVDQFEKDTGEKVAVARDAPDRGKLYYEWLTANAREKWIDWRCRQLSAFYKKIADRISARRPDLRLGIFSYQPTVSELKDPRFGTPGYTEAVNKESGFDPNYYQDASNIIVSQTIYPADYRWSFDHYQKDNPRRESQRDRNASADSYAVLRTAKFPWVNMHDRYWEDPIGKEKPLKAEWLKEHPWRVSTLNPNHAHFMEQFVLPLRHGDILGFSKGGFLIGTTGFEEQVAEFSKAFRALPAMRFGDLPGSTDTVKCRTLTTSETTWFYAVNTAPTAAAISFVFDRQPGGVADAADGRSVNVDGTKLTVALKPYQLRSFKMGKGAAVVSVE